MPDDTLSLCAVYKDGGCLYGEAPDHYEVTARGGSIKAECPDLKTALKYFCRWAESEA
jgi:hypothetical protein